MSLRRSMGLGIGGMLAFACGGLQEPNDGHGRAAIAAAEPDREPAASTPLPPSDHPSTAAVAPHATPAPSGPPVDLTGPAIFWTESDVVLAARLDGTGVRTFATGQYPTGLAVDPVTRVLYWADNMTDAITRAPLDGTPPAVIYTSPERFMNPNGLAVDHAAGRLFFTEFPSSTGEIAGAIRTAGLDGSNPTLLYPAMFPTNVTVVPATSEVYFTDNGTDTVSRGAYDGASPTVLYQDADAFTNAGSVGVVCGAESWVFWGQEGGLYRMHADGSAPAKLVEAGYVTGIAVDATSQRVYFTDNETDTVSYVSYDGSNRTVVHQTTTFANPRGVVVVR